MLDMFKKNFIHTKKDFKSRVKAKMESLGFKSVPKGSLHNVNSLSSEFVTDNLFGFWIVMTLNGEGTEATIRYNIGYKKGGSFSTVPDVYRYFSLNKPGTKEKG